MTLDLIDNIVLFEGHSSFKNHHSVYHLLEGIFMTYNSMTQLENNYFNLKYPNESEEKIQALQKASFSFSGELSQVDSQAVNLFHWYSINLINYARCCGLVNFINLNKVGAEQISKDIGIKKELKKFQNNYLKSIPEIQSVIFFRNKASAHLAFTDPYDKDNSATLLESISIIPTFENGRIYVGKMTRGVGDEQSEFTNNSFSLTENFNSLIPRYFEKYLVK